MKYTSCVRVISYKNGILVAFPWGAEKGTKETFEMECSEKLPRGISISLDYDESEEGKEIKKANFLRSFGVLRLDKDIPEEELAEIGYLNSLPEGKWKKKK
jgi:hypothetical protein